MDAFESTIGMWWLAGRPEEPVPGFLQRRPGRESMPWQLTLHGHLGTARSSPGLVEYQTVHGETPAGRFTLAGASLSQGPSGLRSATVKKTTWTGWQLLRGEHVEDDQLYTHATFQVPGLWHWLGPTGFNAHMSAEVQAGAGRWTRPEGDDELVQLKAPVHGDLTLTLGPTFSETFGLTREARSYHALYGVSSSSGVDLETVTRINRSLADLHAIVTGTPMEPFDVHLETRTGQRLELVDRRRPLGRRWGKSGIPDPFFDTAEVDFPTFIPRWLQLCQDLPAAVGAAVPREDGQFVQSKFLDACNGLEALAAHKWDDSPSTDKELELLERLKDLGVNRDFRDAVKLTLRMRRFPLHKKLERLASSFGEESARWLLGQPVSAWADLSAGLRNSLAHGFAMTGGLGDDDLFVVMAQQAATTVLRLALLREAGYTNERSPSPGELLRHAGNQSVGHPNSQLFRDLTFVARHADHWARWKGARDAAAAGRGGDAKAASP